MKKALLFVLTLALLFSVTACGASSGGTDAAGSANDTSDAPLVRSGNADADATPSNAAAPGADMASLGSLIGGDILLSEYDEATKRMWMDEARQAGCSLEFMPDGSAVYTDEEGSVLIQQPDGSWVMQGEEGERASIGGDWPDNEFTRQIPMPEFGIGIISEDADSFTATFTDATIEQIREYTEQVKAAGFTIDAATEDMEVMEMVIFSYTAQNADGYEINVFSAQGTNGLELRRI